MTGYGRFVVQFVQFVIAPQCGRIVTMRVRLAVVAEKSIEALLRRVALGPHIAEPPLAKRAGHVAFLLQQLTNRHLAGRDGKLPFGLHRLVAAHNGMAGVLTRHQHTPRWRAHRRSRIKIREPHPAFSQAINVRSLDEFLPITAQVTITQIIGHNVNDVG